MFNIVNPKGRMSYPSGPVLEKLLSLELNSKQISAEWLMRGKGEMLSKGASIATPEEALEFLRKSIEELRTGKKK